MVEMEKILNGEDLNSIKRQLTHLMSSTSKKVDFTLVCVILRWPPTVFNTILILNNTSWPGNLSAFYDLKLTKKPSLDKVCTQ